MLVWLEGSGGERTPIGHSCFLGRSPTCGVVISDAKVSRQHALIQGQDPGEFWLIDLGSANGTYVNGRRVSQPCRLSSGDRIGIAGSVFTFRRPKPASMSPNDSTATEATIHDIRNLTCWLLVADIQDSTQLLQKLPPDEAPRVTGRWLAACKKILDQHHGTINKFLGDGFLAYWTTSEQAAKCVAEAMKALKVLQEQATPLFRLVLHYGQVSAGGAAQMGEEALLGAEVSFAFRAEKLAASLGNSRLLTEPAKIQLDGLLEATSEGRHALPGFSGDFPFFTF